MKKDVFSKVDSYLARAMAKGEKSPFLDFNFEYAQRLREHAPRAQRVQGLIERMSGSEQITVEEYLEDVDDLHLVEQRAAYLQSFVDTVLLLRQGGFLNMEAAEGRLKEVLLSVIED